MLKKINHLSTRWKKANIPLHSAIPAQISDWLLYPGSFTKRVQNQFRGTIRIKVINEGLVHTSTATYEYQCFKVNYCYQRAIQIFLNDTLLMYAHSAMPITAPFYYKKHYRGLGQLPLGTMLFSSTKLVRSDFQLTHVLPHHAEYALAVTQHDRPATFLWARRSIFSQQARLLLLTELFSPDFIRLILEH